MRNILLSAVALSLLTSTAGFAQNNDNRRGSESRDDRNDNNRNNNDRGDRRDNDSRNDRNDRNDRNERKWNRGERLTQEYRHNRHIHYGWRDSGLRQPPRGHQWMLVGNQFVLISMRNWSIVEVALVPRRGEGRGYGYGGDRDEMWRSRYKRVYTPNDDVAYTECRNQPDPAGVLAGAIIGGLLGNAVGGRGDRGGATVAGVFAGGALGVALTNKMDCSDRSYAYKTYADGFNGGRANATYRWKNPQNNHRGEMRVLDYYNDEDRFRCAVFSQTVYIANRREEARGRACQQPNGAWVIID